MTTSPLGQSDRPGLTNNPDTALWQSLNGSDAMSRNVGEVEGEEARFGADNPHHNANKLEMQNRLHGGWDGWTNLQCDASQNSITDWWGEKLSNQHWDIVNVNTGFC